MTFPKNKIRRIELKTGRYTWVVSPDSGYIFVFVQKMGSNGGLLKISFDYTVDITPKVVIENIELALGMGWNPIGKDVFMIESNRSNA